VVVHIGGNGVDVHGGAVHVGVPQLRVVLHRVIADGDQHVGAATTMSPG
jgi:hypothetical protein